MRLLSAILGLALVLLPLSAGAQETRYRGMCDASASVSLGANHFIVADDERNVLMIYRRDRPEPAESVDLRDYLSEAPAGAGAGSGADAPEADLEGAARIGDRIYWIASHSRGRRVREQLFATTVVENRAIPTVRPLAVRPYRDLLNDLMNEPKFAQFPFADARIKDPEEDGGFNIEGLAATPEGDLLIGLRNPLTGEAGAEDRKAIIIPITNAQAVVERGEKPAFGDAITLKLGSRGIRSIERVGDRYLIIAGPYDSGAREGHDFGLYTWSGSTTDDPVLITENFGTLVPEALLAVPDGKTIQILSDDGTERVDGKHCKAKSVPLDKKSFRSVTWPMP